MTSFYKDTEGSLNLLTDLEQAVLDAEAAALAAQQSAAAALASANAAAVDAAAALATANGIIADLVGVAYQDEINSFTEANSFSDGTTLNGASTFNNTATFNNVANLSSLTYYDGNNLQLLLDAKLDDSNRGTANGVASLDSGGKVPLTQLANSVMIFKGQHNVSANDPLLADGDIYTAGDVFRVNVAGTRNYGSGNLTLSVGDWLVKSSGGIWQQAYNSINVDSVNTHTGTVVLDTDDIAEDGSPVNLWFTNARARNALGATTSNNVPSLITLSGRTADTTDMGTYTGSTIPNSGTIKSNIQSLETAYEETDSNANDLITLSGRPENSTNLAAFTGITLTSNNTIKECLQEVEVAIEQTAYNLPTPGATITLTQSHINSIVNCTRNNVSAIVVAVNSGVFDVGNSVEIMRGDNGSCTITAGSSVTFLPTGNHAILDKHTSVVITRISDGGGNERFFVRGNI